MIEIILLLGFILAPPVLYRLFERLPSALLRALTPALLALALALIVPQYYQFRLAGPEALPGTLTIVAVQVLGIMTPLPLVMERFKDHKKYLLASAVSCASVLFFFLQGFATEFNAPPVTEAVGPFFFSLDLLSTYLTDLLVAASICGFVLFVDLIRDDSPDFFSKIGWMSAVVVLAPVLYVADCFFIVVLAAAGRHLAKSIRHPGFALSFPLLLAFTVSALLASAGSIVTAYDRPLLVLLLSQTILSLGMVAALEAADFLRLSRFTPTVGILLGAASIKVIDVFLGLTGHPDLSILVPAHPLTGFVLAGVIVAGVLLLAGGIKNRSG
ncbi:hypothetical protein RJ40_12175 [Methanofollis aquaemaris]|uniref:Uncharacterized protein n=1 Tax=Methanofollis aquaemaris TaxID=126734 RepID=A0A8A3S7E2_9EURY|nr:hypothetical protein [Methanofollis aquaemaris]QSZ68197.1 hypothetical protein RJ40_12175 [Methanofollis aquaemaris]